MLARTRFDTMRLGAGDLAQSITQWMTAHRPVGARVDAQAVADMARSFGVAPEAVTQAADAAGQLAGARAQARGYVRYGADGGRGQGAPAAAPGATLGAFRFVAPSPGSRLDALSGGHVHAADFAPIARGAAARARVQLESDLRKTAVPSGGNVLQRIMGEPTLAPAQKDRILAVLTEVRESFVRRMGGDPAAPAASYQRVNWEHTRGEVAEVLASALLQKLTPAQTEDAILASAFSDAVKSPQNFLVHNVAGGQAAAEVLGRHFDVSRPADLARLEGIVAAAREHQISPPAFMGMMLAGSIRRALGADAAPHAATLASIEAKVARPLDPTNLDASGRAIAFTADEQALLGRVGVETWEVPSARTPHHAIARAVIDGDCLINYACPAGFAKIAEIRGPDRGPFFQDATVFDSLASCEKSWADARTVVSDAAQPLMVSGLARTQRIIDALRAGDPPPLSTPLLRNADGTIPFWNAPLAYPAEGQALSARDQAFFEQAKQIRDAVATHLKAAQGGAS